MRFAYTLLLLVPAPLLAQPSVQTQFYEALSKHDVALVRQLLNEGANVNQCPDKSFCPLWAAAYERQPELVAVLLEHNPSRPQINEALLAAAISEAHLADGVAARTAEMLLRAGADPNFHSEGEEHATAIHLAAMGGEVDLVKVLLQHGGDVNLRDFADATPLMIAAGYECSADNPCPVVALLIAHGASLNAQDADGNTALMNAAEDGNITAGRLLLDHGADPTMKNKKGQTALDLSRSRQREKFTEMLEAYKH
jgi:uncharacterized protein